MGAWYSAASGRPTILEPFRVWRWRPPLWVNATSQAGIQILLFKYSLGVAFVKQMLECVMRFFEALLFGLFISATACAQNLSIGIKGGARLTDDLQSSGWTVSESKRYTVGPAVEVNLWRGLGVEFDALYKRVGKSEVGGDFFGDMWWSRDRSNSWEFPILAKYRFLRRSVSPYVSSGYAFRLIGGSGATNSYCCVNPYDPTAAKFTLRSYSTDYKNSSGLVVSGGMEFQTWHLKLSPEFRYTRWSNRALDAYGSHGYYAESAQNQAEILVGIWWLAPSKVVK